MMRQVFYFLFLFITFSLNYSCNDAYLGTVEEDLILEGKRENIFSSSIELEKTSYIPIKIKNPKINLSWKQTGYLSTNNTNNFKGNSKPQISRIINIGSGSSNEGLLTALPVIANNIVYTMDAKAYLRAFDTKNKFKQIFEVRLKYKKEEDNEAYGGGLAFANNNIIATTGYGVVYSINAKNGKIKWRKNIGIPIRSHPKIHANRVYVIDTDNNIHSLQLENGSIIWSYEASTAGLSGVISASVVAVANNIIIAPLDTGELLALNQQGKTLWNAVLIDFSSYNPIADINEIAEMAVIKGKTVFAASYEGYIGAFQLNNGKKIWDLPIKSTVAPTIIGNYLVTISDDKKLYAIHIDTGKIAWIKQLRKVYKAKTITWNKPLLVDSKLLLSSSAGLLITVDPFSGKIIRTYNLKNPVFSTPVISNQKIYLISDNGKLIVLK